MSLSVNQTASWKCIIQARMGSTRLPGKVIMKVGKSLLVEHVIERARESFNDQDIVLATTTDSIDDKLVDIVKHRFEIIIYRGSPLDVRSRFADIAISIGATHLVRITADDPFKDPQDIKLSKHILQESNADYFCNFVDSNLPLGMDIESFSTGALLRSIQIDNSNLAKEHVTITLRENQDFRRVYMKENRGSRDLRLTIDNSDDLAFCHEIALRLKEGNFTWEHTIEAAENIKRMKL